MKQLFIVLILSLFSVTIYSQSQNSLRDDQKIIDSLTTLLHDAKSDSLKCLISFKLSNIYVRDGNLKLFSYYKRKAVSLIKTNTYLKDLSYYYHAADFLLKKDTDGYLKALKMANGKLRKYNSKEIYSIRAIILRNQAVCYQFKNNDREMFRVLTEAIWFAKKANDTEMQGMIYNSIGIIFLNSRSFKKAEYYISESIKCIEKKDSKTISYSENYVETYILYAEILTELKKYDKALQALNKTKKLILKSPNSNLNCYYYSTKGYFEHCTKNYENAIISFNKGLKFGKLTNDLPSINRLQLMKFSTLRAMRRYAEAKNLLVETFNSETLHIEDKKNYSKQLSWVFKELNDFPNALKYSEQYIQLNDSLNEIINKSDIASIETRFRNKENENKIQELEIQKEKALLTAKYNRLNLLAIGLVTVLLLLTTGFLLKNSKNQKRIANQKEINYNQTITAFKDKKELEVMQAMIYGEEAERKRIARDLHDGIGSRLSALKMQLQGSTPHENDVTLLENFSSSLSQSIVELRAIAFNLMPETLLKLGLLLALKDLCHSLSTEKTCIVFHTNNLTDEIKANDQITIFRIVQELITNALKHAHCSEIIVDCSTNENLFLITVEDNGKGFTYSNGLDFNGLGLKNIKNRVEMLNGTFEISSNETRGTCVNIELLLK